MICKLLIIILIIIYLSYSTEEFCVNKKYAAHAFNGNMKTISKNGELDGYDECFYDNLNNSSI